MSRELLERIEANEAAIDREEEAGHDPKELYEEWSDLHIEALRRCFKSDHFALATMIADKKQTLMHTGLWDMAANLKE